MLSRYVYEEDTILDRGSSLVEALSFVCLSACSQLAPGLCAQRTNSGRCSVVEGMSRMLAVFRPARFLTDKAETKELPSPSRGARAEGHCGPDGRG